MAIVPIFKQCNSVAFLESFIYNGVYSAGGSTMLSFTSKKVRHGVSLVRQISIEEIWQSNRPIDSRQ